MTSSLISEIFRFEKSTIVKCCSLLACLFLFQPVLNGQTRSNIDSLKNAINQTEESEERIKLTLELSEQLYKSNALAALEYAEESERVSKKISSDSLLNRAYLSQARIYLQLGNYPRSLQLFQKVIHNTPKNSGTDMLSIAYGSIGSIYYYQNDYKNALKYYTAALEYLKSAKDKNHALRKASLLNNIGIIYDETKKFEQSAHYYKEALKLSQQFKDYELMANVLNNQGTLYRDQGKNDLALKYYQEAMEIRKKHNNKLGLARSYHSLGQFYFNQLRDFQSAETYLKEAVALGQEIGSLETVSSSSLYLYRSYKEQGDYKNALKAVELNMQAKDSLFNAESTRKIAQLEMQFEFDKKQSQQQAKQREKELYYWMMAGGLVLSLIIVSLLFFLQRNKVRNSELKQAHLQLEKKSLENDLAIKDKELATNIMYLLNKNELINTISEKLLEIKQNPGADSHQALQKVVLDLQSNLQPELWKEFEFRFQQVHEQFYKNLNEKFPDLSPSERRLCVFLKLNMTTKEISAITHQNAKSIDVARTRLRKKLNLTGTEHNLVTFLEQLGEPLQPV